MPGQRSGFHICDILDLNNTDPKVAGSSGPDNSDTNTTSLANSTISSRDDAQHFAARHGFLSAAGTVGAYHLPPNINSAMLGESVGQYHPMFPAAAKAWFQEHENYGKHILYKL